MAKQLQVRRGTTMANNLFTGAEGEITMDTVTKGLHVHDGSLRGGYKVPTLVAVQYPSATNNYTWYRKYSDGWVEQGGITTTTGSVTLPVEMADTNYTVTAGFYYSAASTWNAGSIRPSTTTTLGVNLNNANSLTWEVKGMAA